MRSFIDFARIPGANQPAYHRSASRSTRVLLDKAWARELGISRTAGAYRIDRRRLGLQVSRWEQTAVGAQEWAIDPAKTDVVLIARPDGQRRVRRRFEDVSGTIRLAPAPEECTLDLTIEGIGVGGSEAGGQRHSSVGEVILRTTGRSGQDGTPLSMEGFLTVEGVSSPVSLAVRHIAPSPVAPEQLETAFAARARIDGHELGMGLSRSGGGNDGEVEIEIAGRAVARRISA